MLVTAGGEVNESLVSSFGARGVVALGVDTPGVTVLGVGHPGDDETTIWECCNDRFCSGAVVDGVDAKFTSQGIGIDVVELAVNPRVGTVLVV